MTFNEFKAWFDGYTESIEGAPNEKQWERIKEQVQKIAGPSPYDALRKLQAIPCNVPQYPSPWRDSGTPPTVFLGAQATQ